MTEETDEGSRSIGQRGRAAARRVTQPITSATDALTGRSVERQVAEYSETFTQVVLGLHEDLAAANRRISDLERTVAESPTHPPGLHEDLAAANRRIDDLERALAESHPSGSKTSQHLLSLGAVVIALAALVVALWTA